jgi:signal transduction histidine kinase
MAHALRWRRFGRPTALAIVITAITAQHYLTGVSHENLSLHNIHYLLYFLPILMGAIWYGLLGGIAIALLVSLLYAPVVFGHAGQQVFASGTQKVLELIIYNMVGLVTGFLSEREKREREDYRQTAEELQKAYRKLREQTDLIVEKEEQLRRAERLSTLGELAAGIAHEIRNPLASIKGTAEILKDPVTPQARHEEFMELMLNEVDRLNRVVAHFLELARFKKLHREQADITDVLWRMLQLVDVQLDRKNVAVQTHFTPEIPQLSIDVPQMEQAILNLILNSIAAMPDGGTLTLETMLESGDDAGRVVVDISDTGTGIMPEHLPLVFDPFFTTKSDGTGLGLPIIRRILKAHGGTVEITSEAGRGTRVTLALPLDVETTE